MTERRSNITLALESAIAGGSIAIFRDHQQIASWTGPSNVSKAEDLLFNIDAILTENGISRNEIGLIAVSAGPGSFTGIRIGIATALGLKNGLGIKMSSDSALKAMADSINSEGLITAALPVGRDAVCLQSFSRSHGEVAAVDQPYTRSEGEFAESAKADSSATFTVHERLYEKVSALKNTMDFGSDLAGAIGRICIRNPGKVVEPMFISKSF